MRRLEVVMADLREEATIVLYALVDPRFPRRFRYIGVTKDAAMRLRKHVNQPSNGNAALCAWKLALRADGVEPQMLALRAFVSRSEAEAVEWRMIQRLQRRGMADCNAQPLLAKQFEAMAASRARRGDVWPCIRRQMEARRLAGAA